MSLVEESFVDIFEGYRVNGRYRVEGQLGEGGFAEVYRARDEQIDRPVAVKVMNASSLSSDPDVHEQLLERFQREAQLAARVDHPNVTNIYDYGVLEDKDEPFIVMELLDGIDLEGYLDRHSGMPAHKALSLLGPALEALGVAHAQDIIHKDLKPSNLFVKKPDTRFESLCIFDFGIAHIAGEFRKRITQQGELMGTPGYIAPEYATEQIVTPALDVYQMGLILVEMLTGEPVVDHPDPVSAMFQHVHAELEIPKQLVDSPIGAVLACALNPDHERRFPTGMEFADALLDIDPRTLPDVSNGFEVGSLDDVEPLQPSGDAAGASRNSATMFMYGTGVDKVSSADTPAPTLSSHMTPNSVNRPENAGRRKSATDPDEKQSLHDDVMFAPAARPKWPWAIGAVVLLIAGIGVAVFVTDGEEVHKEATDDPMAHAARTSDSTHGEETVAQSRSINRDRAVAVELTSNPPNAEIYEGSKPLGTTPLDVELSGGRESRSITAKLAGHEPVEFDITRDTAASHEIVLSELASQENEQAQEQDPGAEAKASRHGAGDEHRARRNSEPEPQEREESAASEEPTPSRAPTTREVKESKRSTSGAKPAKESEEVLLPDF